MISLKRSVKFRAAKYYNELPEDIKFELDDSERYNKSVLKNYLFNTEQWTPTLPHLHKVKLLNSKFIWNKNLISPQLIIC